MTRLEELEARAKAWLTDCLHRDPDNIERRSLTLLLLQVERETWERMVQYADSRTGNLSREICAGCGNEGDAMDGAADDEDRHISNWCRQQAEGLK